jgi:nucleoside-diphosphate-sugar epimerase
MSKKVFIVGCSGAVGSRLALLLLQNNFIVQGVRGSKQCTINHKNHFCYKIDLLNPNQSLNLLEFKPDIMVHAAWITTPGVFWESPINNDWVSASKRIIQEFKASGGKYLVVTSSCAEYSWNTLKPLSENSEVSPQSNYGKSKLELLKWVSDYNIPFLWTRIFFQFGLNEPSGRLIPSLIDSFLAGKEFEVLNWYDVRDFIYIKDVVNILNILIYKEQLGIVNIGTGDSTDIRSIAQIVADFIGRKDLLIYRAPTKPPSLVVSNSKKMISIVGDYSWTPLRKAISETIENRSMNVLGP